MMRRHARSENAAKIVRKLRSSSSLIGAEGPAAEIGSRVFPLRAAPPPAHMPAVGARRSTRVFVPKAAAPKSGDGESRVLRSGKKRLPVNLGPQEKVVDGEDEWARVFGSHSVGNDLRWWKVEDGESPHFRDSSHVWNDPETPATTSSVDTAAMDSSDCVNQKRFGVFYRRKRLRKESSDGATSSSSASVGDVDFLTDRKYGIYFMRKERKKRLKTASLVNEVRKDTEMTGVSNEEGRTSVRELRIRTSSRNFAWKVGILENDILTGLAGRMILIVLVETSNSSSSHHFARFLTRMCNWTSRPGFSLSDFAGFFLFGSLASYLSEHGVHLLPLRWQRNNSLFRNFLPSSGLCKIYGAGQSIPLLWLDFLALPYYFKSLHMTLLFGSLYLPCVLARYLTCTPTSLSMSVEFEENNSHILVERGHSGSGSAVSAISAAKRKKSHDIAIALRSVAQNAAILRGPRLRKHQKKRSSSRHNRRQNPSVVSSQAGSSKSLLSSWSTVVLHSESKRCTELGESVGSFHVDVPDTVSDDFFSYKDESDVSTPLGSHDKQSKLSKKNNVEQIKELKSALAEVKQNILSARSKANILVTVADRCWREEGCEIMMEFSASKEWCLAVKAKGVLKYLHRPRDMRPCIVNRFTRAYMWIGEDGWKLEFLDRWDWFVFKEMHRECRERNREQVASKMIPVPGVLEVSDYDDYATASFVRTEEYIRIVGDEVQRALTSDIVRYDMDTGDEDWLNKFNSSSSLESGEFSYVSEDNFEKIIYAFEKDAYSNVDDVFDKERAMDLYQDFGNRDMVSAIYDYWIKKRTKRHTALVRVFQGPPLRRPLVHKPYLRKKRSFKRQRSQSSRMKPELPELPQLPELPEAGADEEALHRVKEAESAASRAVESAIHLRNRAQMLIERADLATYRSVMALRIAEAIQASESPDFASILD